MTKWNAAVLGTLLSLLGTGELSAATAKTRHEAVAHGHAHSRHQAAEVLRRRHGREVAAKSGRRQKGKASIYAASLRGQKMADGTPFNPASNAAASKTLPLGATARVTNLENGHTAVVRIRDRGPYKPGRIIDVSPGSANALGMKRDGIASVAVAPLTLPRAGTAE